MVWSDDQKHTQALFFSLTEDWNLRKLEYDVSAVDLCSALESSLSHSCCLLLYFVAGASSAENTAVYLAQQAACWRSPCYQFVLSYQMSFQVSFLFPTQSLG